MYLVSAALFLETLVAIFQRVIDRKVDERRAPKYRTNDATCVLHGTSNHCAILTLY